MPAAISSLTYAACEPQGLRPFLSSFFSALFSSLFSLFPFFLPLFPFPRVLNFCPLVTQSPKYFWTTDRMPVRPPAASLLHSLIQFRDRVTRLGSGPDPGPGLACSIFKLAALKLDPLCIRSTTYVPVIAATAAGQSISVVAVNMPEPPSRSGSLR